MKLVQLNYASIGGLVAWINHNDLADSLVGVVNDAPYVCALVRVTAQRAKVIQRYDEAVCALAHNDWKRQQS